MMNRRSKGVNSESGVVLIVGALVSAGLLLLMFSSIQYANIVTEHLKNYYVAIQIAQQMRVMAPSRQASLDQAAAIAQLNGFPSSQASYVQPVTGRQNLSGGYLVQFEYDNTTVPHQVTVRLEKPINFMAGTLQSLGNGVGLKAFTVKAQLRASAQESYLTAHIDMSASMTGPRTVAANGGQPLISQLLNRYGIPIGGTQTSMGYPIDIGHASLNAATNNHARLTLARSVLPYYFDQSPRPMGYRYDLQRPGPLTIGALGDLPTVNGSGDYEWAYLNPNVDYNNVGSTGFNSFTGINKMFNPNEAAAHGNALVCGNPLYDTNAYSPDGSSAFAIPAPSPNLNPQMAIMPAGYRLAAFDINPGCSSNAGVPCPILDPDPLSPGGNPYNRVADMYCALPWARDGYSMSHLERLTCPAVATTGEVPSPGQCSTQLDWLTLSATDVLTTYRELNQALLMHWAELVPLLDLSIITGPLAFGKISQLKPDGTPISGNKKYFDSVAATIAQGSPAHIYLTPVDTIIEQTQTVPIATTAGTLYESFNVPDQWHSAVRRNLLQAYLDPAHFPVLSRVGTPLAGASYRGARQYLALDNPLRPFPHRDYFKGTYELSEPGFKPTSPPSGLFAGYSLADGDIWGPGPSLFFPVDDLLIPQIQYPAYPFHPSYNNHFDFPALKAVDANGIQAGGAYTQIGTGARINTAISRYAGTMVGWGGTPIDDALQAALDGVNGAEAAFPGIEKFVVLITDGAPQDVCATAPPAPYSCATLRPFGDINTANTLMFDINDLLLKLKAAGATVILLFNDIDSTVQTTNKTAFKNLFTNKWQSDKRALIYFDYRNSTNFISSYGKAIRLLRGITQRPTALRR
jgi:hypothetical protein